MNYETSSFIFVAASPQETLIGYADFENAFGMIVSYTEGVVGRCSRTHERAVDMSFLSESLVDVEYPTRLKEDLKHASICRFLIAFVSTTRLNALGRTELLRVLDSPDSFGVASLSCSCGFRPLLELQGEIGDGSIRLKYFMEPMVQDTDEPEDMVLMHSKLVYLKTKNKLQTRYPTRETEYDRKACWTGAAQELEPAGCQVSGTPLPRRPVRQFLESLTTHGRRCDGGGASLRKEKFDAAIHGERAG